jgi:serine/threonine-protein kinase
VAALLSHPNVCGVYDYGVAGDEPYVVMELLDGVSLAARLAHGPLPWRAAVEICAYVAAALSAAHARGLVHRDIKPGNIMLTEAGVKVVDFGIAGFAGSPVEGPMVGTPAYLAPERLAGEIGGPAVDVYALGIMLFEALTGLRPAGIAALVRDDAELTVPLIPGMPPEVATLYQDCLAVDPGLRPSSTRLAHTLAALAGIRVGTMDSDPVPPPAETQPLTAPAAPPAPPRRRGPPVRRPWARTVTAGVALAAAAAAALAVHAVGLTGAGTSEASSCNVLYQVKEAWDGGATVSLSITNTGRADVEHWTLAFDLQRGLRSRAGWNGVWSQQGTHVSVAATPDNANLAAGTSVSDVGTNIDGPDAGSVPDHFVLNGVRCRSGTPLP